VEMTYKTKSNNLLTPRLLRHRPMPPRPPPPLTFLARTQTHNTRESSINYARNNYHDNGTLRGTLDFTRARRARYDSKTPSGSGVASAHLAANFCFP